MRTKLHLVLLLCYIIPVLPRSYDKDIAPQSYRMSKFQNDFHTSDYCVLLEHKASGHHCSNFYVAMNGLRIRLENYT